MQTTKLDDYSISGIEIEDLECKMDNWATKVNKITMEAQSEIIEYFRSKIKRSGDKGNAGTLQENFTEMVLTTSGLISLKNQN